jgi:hypothetical protein
MRKTGGLQGVKQRVFPIKAGVAVFKIITKNHTSAVNKVNNKQWFISENEKHVIFLIKCKKMY